MSSIPNCRAETGNITSTSNLLASSCRAGLYFFSERAARRGGGGVRCQTFSLFFFPCSADHERDWLPCKVVFFGLATNALNVRNNNNNNNNYNCSLDSFKMI